jgi:hypothetical protein
VELNCNCNAAASRRKPAATATGSGVMQLRLQLQLRYIPESGVDVVGRGVGRVELNCNYKVQHCGFKKRASCNCNWRRRDLCVMQQ